MKINWQPLKTGLSCIIHHREHQVCVFFLSKLHNHCLVMQFNSKLIGKVCIALLFFLYIFKFYWKIIFMSITAKENNNSFQAPWHLHHICCKKKRKPTAMIFQYSNKYIIHFVRLPIIQVSISISWVSLITEASFKSLLMDFHIVWKWVKWLKYTWSELNGLRLCGPF